MVAEVHWANYRGNRTHVWVVYATGPDRDSILTAVRDRGGRAGWYRTLEEKETLRLQLPKGSSAIVTTEPCLIPV